LERWPRRSPWPSCRRVWVRTGVGVETILGDFNECNFNNYVVNIFKSLPFAMLGETVFLWITKENSHLVEICNHLLITCWGKIDVLGEMASNVFHSVKPPTYVQAYVVSFHKP
jgi:hypothetical protein